MCAIFTSYSCTEKSTLTKVLKAFNETKVVIPDDLECVYNKEISKINLDTLKSNKFIFYYDSLSCSSCRISHLIDIYPLYEMSDTSKFSILTIFSPRQSELEYVRLQLKLLNHSIPVYLDCSGSFSHTNSKIPEDQRFHNFLIDNNGTPIFVGNPLSSMKLKELFINILHKH